MKQQPGHLATSSSRGHKGSSTSTMGACGSSKGLGTAVCQSKPVGQGREKGSVQLGVQNSILMLLVMVTKQ